MRYTARHLAVTLAVAAALLGSGGCGRLLSLSDDDCGIGTVGARATDTQHAYSYTLDCGGELAGKVGASYDVLTHRAEEKLTTASGVVTAAWSCPRDPWIRNAADGFVCTQLTRQANLQVDSRTLTELLSSRPPTYPYSATQLTAANRAVLNGQLQNAIEQQQRPPPPTATPTPNQRCTANACQILPEVKPTSLGLAAPADFTGTLTASRTRIVLAWTASPGAKSYELRGTNEDSGLFFTKTLPAPTTAYADEIGLNQSGAFMYELKACDDKGCSAPVTVVVPLSALRRPVLPAGACASSGHGRGFHGNDSIQSVSAACVSFLWRPARTYGISPLVQSRCIGRSETDSAKAAAAWPAETHIENHRGAVRASRAIRPL